MTGCEFRALQSLPSCGEPHRAVIADRRLCENHIIAMYPDVEGYGIEGVVSRLAAEQERAR